MAERITLPGVEGVLYVEEVIAELRKRLEEEQLKFGENITRAAFHLAPKDTGDMASSGRVIDRSHAGGRDKRGRFRKQFTGIVIKFDHPAAHVELGTKNMGRQPFVWPAYEQHKDGYLDSLRGVMGRG